MRGHFGDGRHRSRRGETLGTPAASPRRPPISPRDPRDQTTLSTRKGRYAPGASSRWRFTADALGTSARVERRAALGGPGRFTAEVRHPAAFARRTRRTPTGAGPTVRRRARSDTVSARKRARTIHPPSSSLGRAVRHSARAVRTRTHRSARLSTIRHAFTPRSAPRDRARHFACRRNAAHRLSRTVLRALSRIGSRVTRPASLAWSRRNLRSHRVADGSERAGPAPPRPVRR